jgi:serine/threonine protein kinase
MTINSLKGPQDKNQYQNLTFYKKGGMGEIYLSDDTVNKVQVAIKLISIDNADEVKLLENESKISLTLVDKNIVKTTFASTVNLHGIDYFYQVMEFHANGSLRMKLKSLTAPLPLNECFKIMLDLANGLSYAHKTIIHRDLKPENILIGSDGNYKICDFGLAKYIDNRTRTHSFKGSGTLPYMAPECWTFEVNTVAMDIYSLGIIYFEILTNKLPFTGKNESELKDKHLFEPLPNILEQRGDIPIRIVQMINKMTNKRASERYPSMQEIIAILEEVEHEKKDVPTNNDKLLQLAAKKIEGQKKVELEQQKQHMEFQSKEKLLEHSIEMLFDRLIVKIKELNSQLEEVKIYVRKNKRNLVISFQEKSIQFSFSNESAVKDYLRDSIENAKNFQKRQYGFIIQEIPKSFLEKDQVILIGKAQMNNGYSEGQWGYNLLLRKTGEEDLYGEWSIVWFNDSAFIARHPLLQHYPLDTPDFFQEYEFGRGNVMHVRNMVYKLFTNEDIDETIGKILE